MNSFETCRARKNCGIKIIYNNCASRWSSTHCNMMHGTHSVTLTHCNMMHGTHNVQHCVILHVTYHINMCVSEVPVAVTMDTAVFREVTPYRRMQKNCNNFRKNPQSPSSGQPRGILEEKGNVSCLTEGRAFFQCATRVTSLTKRKKFHLTWSYKLRHQYSQM